MTQWLRTIRWRNDSMPPCPEASPQQLEVSVIQWLGDDQPDALRPESSVSAERVDDALVERYNDEIGKKATMQRGRQIAEDILSRFDSF